MSSRAIQQSLAGAFLLILWGAIPVGAQQVVQEMALGPGRSLEAGAQTTQLASMAPLFNEGAARRAPLPGSLRDRLLGFLALDLERQAGFSVSEEHYALLEGLLHQARERLGTRARHGLTRQEALAVLSELAAIVGTVCRTLAADVGGGLYSAALGQRACDCDVLALTYLTISEVLDLPLYGVLAPDHFLLRWDDGATTLLWETTAAKQATESYYIERLHIADVARARGGYLTSLSKPEMIGYLYNHRGWRHYEAGQMERARADFDRATALHPTLVMAYSGRGAVYQAQERYLLAKRDYAQALAIDPWLSDAYYGRGRSSFYQEEYAAAIQDFTRVIELEEGAADAYYGRGRAAHRLGRLERAIQDYTQAVSLDSTLAQAYYNRGHAHVALGERPQAIGDLITFIRLALGDPAYRPHVPQVQRLLVTLRKGMETPAAAEEQWSWSSCL